MLTQAINQSFHRIENEFKKGVRERGRNRGRVTGADTGFNCGGRGIGRNISALQMESFARPSKKPKYITFQFNHSKDYGGNPPLSSLYLPLQGRKPFSILYMPTQLLAFHL